MCNLNTVSVSMICKSLPQCCCMLQRRPSLYVPWCICIQDCCWALSWTNIRHWSYVWCSDCCTWAWIKSFEQFLENSFNCQVIYSSYFHGFGFSVQWFQVLFWKSHWCCFTSCVCLVFPSFVIALISFTSCVLGPRVFLLLDFSSCQSGLYF